MRRGAAVTAMPPCPRGTQLSQDTQPKKQEGAFIVANQCVSSRRAALPAIPAVRDGSELATEARTAGWERSQ